MKVGVRITKFNFPGNNGEIGRRVKEIATNAEVVGFNSIWVMDHFLQIKFLGEPEERMLEAYSTLGYLAGITNKIHLGALVTGVIYREPAVLIKAVTALDVLSGGRAYFGIGAGWFDYEAKALGLLDPLTSNRFTRLEETIMIAKQMWSGEEKPFDGKIYHLGKTISNPQPIQKPHPPILIGGGGEQKTLKFVAKYGDACNLFGDDLEVLKRKIEVLKQHCKELGRPYDEIEKTVGIRASVNEFASNTKEFLDNFREFSKLGINHIILNANSNDVDISAYEKLVEPIKIIHEM